MKRIQILLICGMILTLTLTVASDSKKEVVIHAGKAEVYVNDAGTGEEQMLIMKDLTGDPSFYMGRALFQPGAAVPEHTHEGALEAVYVLNGTGQLTIGKQNYEIGSGAAVYIPPNTPHSFTNSSKEPVEVIHMYAPGGPEDRFKSWKLRK